MAISTVRIWSACIAGMIGAATLLPGCGQNSQPATERTLVGAWVLDTPSMTDEALQRVELRLREQRARPAANQPQGEGAAATAPAPADGPSPQEISDAKEKERLRLAGTFATVEIQPDGIYLAEYRTDIDNKKTRRVVRGEWVLAAGVLLLTEEEVMLNSEGQTTLESHRYDARASRLSAITLRGAPPAGEVQEILRRRGPGLQTQRHASEPRGANPRTRPTNEPCGASPRCPAPPPASFPRSPPLPRTPPHARILDVPGKKRSGPPMSVARRRPCGK